MNQDKIKLYVHGVPKGQDTWGLRDVNSIEAQYIRTFYSPGANDNEQMYVDIQQYDGRTSSYYTYKRGKTIDNDNRPGGYCAVTIRVDDYYYADIQNMFNLLKAAFEKYIVGSLLKQKSGSYQFLISKFEQKQDDLRRLESDIKVYLMNFSSNSDFLPLDGFKSNMQGQNRVINLIDATPAIATALVKSQGGVVVSMFCGTAKEQQINAQVDKRIKAVEDQARRDVDAARNQAMKQIEAHKKKEEEALRGAKDIRTQLESTKCELGETKEKLAKIKDILHGVNGNPQSTGNDHSTTKAFKRLYQLSCIMLVLSAIVLCFAIFFGFCRDWEVFDATAVESSEATTSETVDNAGSSKDTEQTADVAFPNEDLLKAEYSNARIDISFINNQKPMRISAKDYYPIHLLGVEPAQKRGQWQSSDFDIDGESIKPKHEGKCTISYVVDDITVVSRELNVAK